MSDRQFFLHFSQRMSKVVRLRSLENVQLFFPLCNSNGSNIISDDHIRAIIMSNGHSFVNVNPSLESTFVVVLTPPSLTAIVS